MRIRSKYLDEKLTAADPTSKWISDFITSDNPRFANKSVKERINMALGASYAAKGQSRNEETYSDTGWKKPQTQAKTKNVSGNLARKAMKQSEKETKKEKGFGPSPADKLSIRKEEVEELDEISKEEVEELDEISKDTLKSYADKSIKDAETRRKQGNAYEKLVPSDPDYAKTFYKKSAKRLAGATNAMSRLAKEEVELDEGKYGAFRVGPRRPKYPHVPQGNQDPRTGLPLGFSPPPNKDEPKDKKVKEEVELDELDQSTLTKYATRAKFSSDPKRRAGAEKAQEKINKKSKDMQKEEAEQVDEVLDSAGKVMSYATKATVSGLKSAITGTGKFRKRQAGIQTALRKTKEKIANEEVDESIGSTVGGLVGQYAGSKLGMEGPGRAHGELAGRAIEYHVRKFANRLKKKITGKNESVEVEEDNKAYRAQDKASRETTGMSLPQRSKMYDDIQKKLKDQEEEYRKQGILPPKNEEVELEEDGKLKGGAKDPCWKGYQMVGTKKKNGREVPNCVPREGKEYKSFKALREELNGDSNRS